MFSMNGPPGEVGVGVKTVGTGSTISRHPSLTICLAAGATFGALLAPERISIAVIMVISARFGCYSSNTVCWTIVTRAAQNTACRCIIVMIGIADGA